jgi:hypothetical protein
MKLHEFKEEEPQMISPTDKNAVEKTTKEDRIAGGIHVHRKLSLALLAAAAIAQAGQVVDIDSQKWGCNQCSGPQNVNPGTAVTPFYTGGATGLLQLTLGAGTYTIANADPLGTDYYSAWNFQGYPSTGNWAWSFMIANDATDKVLMDDYIGAVQATQLAMSDLTGQATYDGQSPGTLLPATSTAGFTDTLTLSVTTTLDFFVDDYALGDNGGGVALSITPVTPSSVPEPGTVGGTLAGLALLAIAVRRRA